MKFLLILLLFWLTACQPGGSAGKIGIEVPLGDTRVTSQNPYVVVGVYENSPAYRAGVRPDDVILQVNGRPLRGMLYDEVFYNHLQGKRGEPLTLVIERNGENYVFQIVRE